MADKDFSTEKMPAKSGSGYPGQARSEGDTQGFQSGDNPHNDGPHVNNGKGKGVGKVQGLGGL